MLQNIHLVARWLGILDKKVERYSSGSHEDYRVFISAEPAPTAEAHIIPQGILENAIKITNEPPTGMYANLHKALDLFTQVGRATLGGSPPGSPSHIARQRRHRPCKLRYPCRAQRPLHAGLRPTPHQHANVTSEYVPKRANSPTTEVVDAAWPLAGITTLSVGRSAQHYCGGPVLSWVTILPELDPTPPLEV